jgi:competence protein ComEC
MPFLTAFFFIGILLVQLLTKLPTVVPLMVIFALFFIALYQKTRWLISCLSGFLWAILYGYQSLSSPLPLAKESVELQISGYVDSLPQYSDRRVRFDFILDPLLENLPKKIRLNWYSKTQRLEAGQYWNFTVKLKRPSGVLNPYGFDYERYLFTQGIGATGYVRLTSPPVRLKKKAEWHIISLRQQISQQLERIAASNNQLPLIKALSIGDHHQITNQQWTLLRHTGTTHLLAISGLHIGLVAGLVFFLSQKLWAYTGILRLSPQKFAAINGLCAAGFYAALAGFSISTQRALLMVIMALLLLVFQRHLKQSTLFATVLGVILLINPLVVLSAGFWLSFFAIFLIFYTNSKQQGATHWFQKTLKTHLLLTLGLAPLLAYFFQEVSLISPVANFIAIPWVSFFIVPSLLIAVAVGFVSPFLSAKLLLFVGLNLELLFKFLQTLADFPFAVISLSVTSIGAVLCAMIGLLLLLAPRGVPARHLGIIFCLPLFLGKQNSLNEGEFKLFLLDVGQGLSTVIQTRKYWLIFDTGARYSEKFDMGKAVIVPFLKGLNISKIDRLIISHADNDHIGGLKSIKETLNIKSLVSSAAIPQSTPCLSGQQWQWDGIKFTFLSPNLSQFDSKNNNSCVLKIESAYGSALLTGDIEAISEAALVENSSNNLKSDLLIAPHHGSKTSSTPAFLGKVRPKWILIPSGYKNRYHFPHASVLTRYQAIKSIWFSTANNGMLTATFKQSGQSIDQYRSRAAKYWNPQK